MFIRSNSAAGVGHGPGRFKKLARRFAGEQDGVTASEYAVVLAGLVLVMIIAIAELGQKLDAMYTNAVNSAW